MTYPDDPYRPAQPRFTPAGQEQQLPPTSLRRPPAQQGYTQQYRPPPQPAQPAASRGPARPGLSAAGKFWYILGCIPLGAFYFAKIPAKKALEDFGLAELTGAESFWYILMCIGFGAGYFAKLPTAKAISELEQFRAAGHAQLEYASGYAGPIH